MSNATLSPKNALVAEMVAAGLGAKSTLARKPLADLEAAWAKYNEVAPEVAEPEAGSQPADTDEDLLGEDDLLGEAAPADEPTEDEDPEGDEPEAGSQPDDAEHEMVPAEEVEIGATVLCTRKRKRNVPVVVARVRVGRKHVTVYDESDQDIVWVPVGTEIPVLAG